MPTVGLSEWIVVLMILLLVFGASRLPQIGEGLGRSIGKLKRAVTEDEAAKVAAAKGGAGQSKADIADAEIVEKPRE